ncbi:HAD domain-containing protein [Nocardia fluminea]|uniref:HAD domain-containing protein n=1 Tax=Nocardia fluminea TaxID=134984 RepID=UPI00365A1759
MTRPLLYLDVDGPLNPFRARPEKQPDGYDTHRMMPPSWIARHGENPVRRSKPLRVWLNPEHGPKLLALAEYFELVWATMWEHDANEFIAPQIGLPELPVIEWVNTKRLGPDGTFWKTAELIEHAAGRSFAWVDDDITTHDRQYTRKHHSGAALLRFVHPAVGLTDEDFETLAAWAIAQAGVEGSAASIYMCSAEPGSSSTAAARSFDKIKRR